MYHLFSRILYIEDLKYKYLIKSQRIQSIYTSLAKYPIFTADFQKCFQSNIFEKDIISNCNINKYLILLFIII